MRHVCDIITQSAFTGCRRRKASGTQTYGSYFKCPVTQQMRCPVTQQMRCPVNADVNMDSDTRRSRIEYGL